MSSQTPFARLERELEAAAARQISPARRRRWWRRHTVALFGIVLGVGAGAAAWAATSLLSSGAPVPFVRGAPIAGRAQGAPIPGTVKLLVGDVADPAGGAPWGLRYWETDRKYACVQVGRVWEGKLGQISGGKVFHELRLGVTNGALGGCFLLDGSGHAFTAIHTDAQPGAQPQPCPTGFHAGTALRGPHGRTVRCTAPRRTIDFGLLGANAASFTYRAAGRDHTAHAARRRRRVPRRAAALKPVMREFGFHHKDPSSICPVRPSRTSRSRRDRRSSSASRTPAASASCG